jgi:hypothetical protein
MKRKKRDFEIFSLSFLDVISCGFGAVVLLVLISPFAESVLTGGSGQTGSLLERVLGAERRVEDLEDAIAREEAALAALRGVHGAADAEVARSRDALEAAETRTEEAQRNLEGLELVHESLDRAARASISVGEATVRDEEVGGIPVDADYVVFIVDTSGSMQSIWPRVTAEVENIIRIHPQIKGFQVLNDNGAHLISGYRGRWIPDTPRRRQSAIDLFRTWRSASNSSPVEGLEVALKRYVNPRDKVSIYIFGDDYTGGSYDPVIRTLNDLNRNRLTGEPQARVHAIAFLSQQTQGRFEILMREVARTNNGTFIALPR